MPINTSYSLYLYSDEELPGTAPGGSVLLGEYASSAELHTAVKKAAASLQPAGENHRWLCASKYAEEILPDTDALVLSPELLQQMEAGGMEIEYDYCPGDLLDTRRRNLMSFFLLTFPQEHPSLPDDFIGTCFFPGKHQGQHFILTPDQYTLEDYLCHLSETGFRNPRLRIDYFSTGSLIWWLTGRETIRALAQIGTTLELRIHPAMLVAEDDSIRPLAGYLMRSRNWRHKLRPPEE